MFVENFDEMYAKITEVRGGLEDDMFDWNGDPLDEAEEYMPMSWFSMQAIALIQRSIDRLRELGVPDYAMTFTVAELAVLSEMPGFDIKIRWIKKDKFYHLTQQ